MYEKYEISEDPVWNKCLNLLVDDAYSEIQSNGPSDFFTKKNGKRIRIEGVSLPGLEEYVEGIKRGLVKHIHSPWPFQENTYLYEGPLRYYAGDKYIRGRCHIVLPPASDYPQVTIAKKSTALPSLDAIASRGSMSTEMMALLLASIAGNLTIIISGGTGSGKTTMLEALAKNFREDHRIGVAEDAPEIYLPQPNVSYLHSVPWQPGMNPNDVATLSWVVQQYQRMRTDKLIIGETRGAEFADFLIAANSGMDGSMTTIHANDAVQALTKMTNFALKASNSPVKTINQDIAASVDIIVQLTILEDGRHRVKEIVEVTNTIAVDDSAKITTNPLFRYEASSDTFVKVGQLGDFLRNKLTDTGVDVKPFLISQIGVKQMGHTNSQVGDEIVAQAAPKLANPDAGRPAGLPILGGGRRL